MDFTLTAEEQAIRQTVRVFVEREVLPFESVLIQREMQASPARAVQGASGRQVFESHRIGASLSGWLLEYWSELHCRLPRMTTALENWTDRHDRSTTSAEREISCPQEGK